ncbi:BUB1 N-terminal domain-containing protein [Haematococcus lacustris]|uniref:BUB1 N-terminal domain-containing protein n=1 Tax=Haematococcus lacustris TaxID=44745 RepID=A0A699YZT3_HAELA|nr:BUB1 N-terminal domain-containing protein [Haematococcus lacustris]
MEGDAWELAKENCVPVRSGRNKAALSELQADPADTTAKLALQLKRKELWQEVCDYKGNDPLEPWQRFIKWTQEHKAGNKADLQKLYEQCTSALLKLPRYNDDIRFLRIWIQYDKGLGLQFALFHEAYATFFELRGNCSAADAVYLDGINRQAKPLERLRQKYLAFQNRMAQRIQRRIQEDGSTADPPAAADGPVRASLAPLVPLPGAGAARGSLPTGPGSTSALVLPPHLRAQAAFSSRDCRPMAAGSSLLGVSRPASDVSSLAAAGMRQGTGLGLAGARPIGSLPPGSQPGQGSRGQGLLAGGALFSAQPGAAEHAVSAGAAGRLVVAMDDEFRQGVTHAGAPPAGYSLVPEGVQNLKELKPYAQIRKENTDKAGVWAGATLTSTQCRFKVPGSCPDPVQAHGRVQVGVSDLATQLLDEHLIAHNVLQYVYEASSECVIICQQAALYPARGGHSCCTSCKL